MLTTAIWGFAYPDVGDPYLFDQPSQKEKISHGIPSFTSQTRKIWKACIIFFVHSGCSFN